MFRQDNPLEAWIAAATAPHAVAYMADSPTFRFIRRNPENLKDLDFVVWQQREAGGRLWLIEAKLLFDPTNARHQAKPLNDDFENELVGKLFSGLIALSAFRQQSTAWLEEFRPKSIGKDADFEPFVLFLIRPKPEDELLLDALVRKPGFQNLLRFFEPNVEKAKPAKLLFLTPAKAAALLADVFTAPLPAALTDTPTPTHP